MAGSPPRRRWPLPVAAVVVGLIGLLAGYGSVARDAEAPSPGTRWPARSLAPDEGALLGAWVKPRGSETLQARMRAVSKLESQLGRRLDVNHHFYPWDKPFPTQEERWDLKQGRIPLISWNGTYTDQIASGAHDDLIRTRAAGVRALGRPVLLRWFWEMDGDNSRHLVASPASYVAAWRHIRNLFAAAGADNVAWVWCPNADAFTSGEVTAYYPGDAAVDWICADGYNWAPGRPGSNWRSFEEIFTDFYRWGSARDKPLMIGEFGVQERGPGEKPAWLKAAAATLKTRFPKVAAVVYFSSDRRYPWWLDSSAEALEAFRQIAAESSFNRPRRP
jgi:Glycosyl hydrolase family 26